MYAGKTFLKSLIICITSCWSFCVDVTLNLQFLLKDIELFFSVTEAYSNVTCSPYCNCQDPRCMINGSDCQCHLSNVTATKPKLASGIFIYVKYLLKNKIENI